LILWQQFGYIVREELESYEATEFDFRAGNGLT
jgi:hypothetical protein